MKKKISVPGTYILMLFGLLFFTNSANSQNDLSLTDCILYGLTHNPGVKKAQLDTDKGEIKVKEIYSAYLPQVKANASINDNLKLQTSILPGEIFGMPGQTVAVQFGTHYNVTAGIDINQVVFDPGIFSGLQMANQSLEISALNQEITEEQLLFNIAQAYYSAQITATQKGLLETNLKNMDTLAMISKIKYENKFILKTDYDRVIINQINLQTQLNTLDLNYQKQLRLLKYYLGMPIDSAITIEPAVKEVKIAASPEYSSNTTLDMRMLQMQNSLYYMNIKQIRSGYVPSLSLGFRYAYQAQQNTLNIFGNSAQWFPNSYLTLNLSIPIFDGFTKARKVQQLEIDIMKNELDQATTSSYLDMQYQNAASDLKISNATLNVQLKNIELAEELYRVTKSQFEVSLSTLSDLLNAENALQDAQANYMRALIQIKVAQLDLLRTTGSMQTLTQQ